MSSIKLAIVVGTRPNFIKVTQFRNQCEAQGGIDLYIIHTGQHYDQQMSGIFFEQFKLVPDHFLNIGQGSPTEQMAEAMVGLEKKLLENSLLSLANLLMLCCILKPRI